MRDAYRVEDSSGGDGLMGHVAVQSRSQALLKTLHVWIASEELQAFTPGRGQLGGHFRHSFWEVLQ